MEALETQEKHQFTINIFVCKHAKRPCLESLAFKAICIDNNLPIKSLITIMVFRWCIVHLAFIFKRISAIFIFNF